ncbi:MAG: FAD-binding oxidoreductase [Streptosporangiaceae bacterium]
MTDDQIPEPVTAACRAVRFATPSDDVAGVRPRFVASPASTEEVSALLRAASALGLAVIPRGTGSRLHWGYPPRRCDLIVDMTAMDQVIEHAAGDLVATVQAGVTLERLAEVLGAAGQRLALDPPASRLASDSPDRADAVTAGTVGGVLSTGVTGPLRFRYGSPRDLLLGITMVRADGTVAKVGGKVVKNVAGYDIGRLLAGSRGTLGIITEATLRLHPLPAASATVTAECIAAVEACRLVTAAVESPLTPVSADLAWPSINAPATVSVGLEGDPAAVADRATALTDLLNRAAARAADAGGPGGHSPAADAVTGFSSAIAATETGHRTHPLAAGGTGIQVAFWPGDLGMVLAEIRAAALEAGLDPAVSGSAGAGVLDLILPASAPPGAVARFVTGLRAALGHGLPGQTGRPRPATPRDGPPARANVVIQYAPPDVRDVVDLFGPVPSLALMRAVKQQFDPRGILSPGRFVGGI